MKQEDDEFFIQVKITNLVTELLGLLLSTCSFLLLVYAVCRIARYVFMGN